MPRLSSQPAAIRGWRPAEAAPSRRTSRSGWFTGSTIVSLAAVVFLFFGFFSHAAPDIPLPQSTPMTASVHVAPALPACVSATLPQGVDTEAAVLSRQQLLQGRMLLIDEAHPLPADWRPADSTGILQATAGRVACRDLAAVSGQDTLSALEELFTEARYARIIQLTVFAASRSPEQQRLLQTDTFAALSRDMSLENALVHTRKLVASIGCSEHQTTWAVDIRVCPRWNAPADESPLDHSKAGQWLLRHAWEYGFIHRWPDPQSGESLCGAYHFRYVGRAHAMLMHELSLTLEDYLTILHEKGTLTLTDENGAPLATAVCVAEGERQAAFTLPVNGLVDDVSLDNQGWAVVSCLYPSANAAPAT